VTILAESDPMHEGQMLLIQDARGELKLDVRIAGAEFTRRHTNHISCRDTSPSVEVLLDDIRPIMRRIAATTGRG